MQGDYLRNITSLISAMGVRALTDLYAKHWIRPWLAQPGELPIRSDGLEILRRFLEGAER